MVVSSLRCPRVQLEEARTSSLDEDLGSVLALETCELRQPLDLVMFFSLLQLLLFLGRLAYGLQAKDLAAYAPDSTPKSNSPLLCSSVLSKGYQYRVLLAQPPIGGQADAVVVPVRFVEDAASWSRTVRDSSLLKVMTWWVFSWFINREMCRDCS